MIFKDAVRPLCGQGSFAADTKGVMVRASVYRRRTTEAERKAKRRAAHERWAAKHRPYLLQKKREWARRAETLARRRELYRSRREGVGGVQSCLLEPPAPPKPLTLDDFARI